MIVVIVMVSLIVCLFLIVWVSAILVDTSKEYDTQSKYYRFLVNFLTWIVVHVSNVRIEVHGEEKLPKSGQVLLVQNHRSNYDPILTWYAIKNYDFAFLSKGENMEIPIINSLVRKCCFMTIDRDNPKNAMKAIMRAARLIENNEVSIGIYPEGTRNQNYQTGLLSFHNGVFKIAQLAKSPIVATTIRGTEKIAKNAPFKRTKIVIDIVDVIMPEEINRVRTNVIGDRIIEKMNEVLVTEE